MTTSIAVPVTEAMLSEMANRYREQKRNLLALAIEFFKAEQADPSFSNRILQLLPEISTDELVAFLNTGAVGDARMLNWKNPGINLLRFCPIPVIRRALTDGVDVLVWESGRTECLKMPPEELDAIRRKQIFKGRGASLDIRTLAQQKQFISDTERQRQKVNPSSFRLNGDEVIFRLPVSRLSRASVVEIAERLGIAIAKK